MGAFALKSCLFKTLFHTNLYSTANNAVQSFHKTASITYGEENIWGTSNSSVKYLVHVLWYKSNLWYPSSQHEYFFHLLFYLVDLGFVTNEKKRVTAELSRRCFFLCPNRNNFSNVIGSM